MFDFLSSHLQLEDYYIVHLRKKSNKPLYLQEEAHLYFPLFFPFVLPEKQKIRGHFRLYS